MGDHAHVLAARVGELLRGRTLACAESCTAGLVAQSFAAVTGSRDWFRGALVAYQRQVKLDLLGVTATSIVSPLAAREMARGAAKLFAADVSVSTTGAAGPDPLDGAEPGTIVIGTFVGGRATAQVHHVSGTPAEVCTCAAEIALRELIVALETDEGTSP
jgi:PncC family amidohydrolase